MDLSIIILSYNTKDITDKCLGRLKLSVGNFQKKGGKVQTIVLDNASSDGSVEMIKKNHPWVELTESRQNLGYSKGNNTAFKKAKYSYILFMNSDLFVEDDTLEKSIKYFNENDCDALGIKLTYENNSLQPSAGNLPNPVNTILWILGLGQLVNPFHPKNKEYFQDDKRVGWVSGAFILIKREIFEEVSGFDEDIFMYMDEIDLFKKIEQKGYKVNFTPKIKAIHLHRASSRDNIEKAFTLELKGIKIYFEKYFAGSYPLVRIFLVLGLILRIIAFSLLGKTKRARAYVEGLLVV